MTAKLEGAVTLAPQRSQIAVVAVFGLALVGFLTSGAFLWHDKLHAWVPMAFTVACLLSGLWMWNRSRQSEADPTKVTVTGDAVEVQTPAATFNDPHTFNRVLSLVSAIGNRQPLPPPAGLVNERLQPLPNSAEDAAKRAAAINADGAALELEALRALTASDRSSFVLAEPNQTKPLNELGVVASA